MLKRLIAEAGGQPVERDSLYRPVIRDGKRAKTVDIARGRGTDRDGASAFQQVVIDHLDIRADRGLSSRNRHLSDDGRGARVAAATGVGPRRSRPC